jgi:hypothetical protein
VFGLQVIILSMYLKVEAGRLVEDGIKPMKGQSQR